MNKLKVEITLRVFENGTVDLWAGSAQILSGRRQVEPCSEVELEILTDALGEALDVLKHIADVRRKEP